MKWSAISLGLLVTAVSTGCWRPYYGHQYAAPAYQQPVYQQPAPVYQQPAPVYQQPVMQQAPVMQGCQPVVCPPNPCCPTY